MEKRGDRQEDVFQRSRSRFERGKDVKVKSITSGEKRRCGQQDVF